MDIIGTTKTKKKGKRCKWTRWVNVLISSGVYKTKKTVGVGCVMHKKLSDK